MNKNHVSIAFGIAFLTLGVLVALGGGCTFHVPQFHWRIGDVDWDAPTVDGVELKHKATLHFVGTDRPARIAMTLECGSITIEGDPNVTGVEADFDVREKTPGDVSLAASPDGVVAKSASGSPLLVVSARLRVPAKTPVRVAASLGRVTISGIADVTDVSATSDAGSVELRGLSNVERVEGKTNLGKASLADANGCADIVLETDAGSVRATRVEGAKRAKLKTSLGEVRVEKLSATESLTCESDAGGVRVSDVSTGQCRLKSDLGEVRAERCTFDHVYAHTDLGGVRLKACAYKTKDVGTDLGSVDETK